jgi:6-phosphogluconolactonase
MYYDFDSDTGDFNLKMFQNTINPSYLTVSNDNNFVYSVNENGKESKVSAFSYTSSTGKLDFLNSQNSMGPILVIINDEKM